MMPHFLSVGVHFVTTAFDHLAFAGMFFLRSLTIYNKVQEALRDERIAALVLVETRKSRKLSMIILTALLSYYAQLGYLNAAAWLAFLILLSSVIIAICDRIDNFHTIRPLLFVFLHSVPGLSVYIVLVAEIIRVLGNVIVIVCQLVVLLGLGLLMCCLKKPERREEHDGPQSAEEARTSLRASIITGSFGEKTSLERKCDMCMV
ncbi:hypothetical protein K435DRAFT_796494 [Dendrothele bispora CBS 962.96]|uniref:Uncharacterized protein n=1 Tax=Dendrothele bispora (strain CBS 962.96) TaxID=1314807 RepID=A0A4S8M5E9_DENBC|nr:hypothetical protein K435DRAFT_796494 [Dendrothele bispora CBS 962.96]